MIEIANLSEFQGQLKRLLGALEGFQDTAYAELGQRLEQALLMLAGHASVYPQAPPGSRYDRTRTLGRLWTAARPQVAVTGHVMDARIGNNTPYGPYVQDPEAQAWMHAGRWRTTHDVAVAHAGEVSHLVAQAGPVIVQRIASAV